MRIDLLEQWLKMFPYGYCDGMNFQTCRANENNCPYCMSTGYSLDEVAELEEKLSEEINKLIEGEEV